MAPRARALVAAARHVVISDPANAARELSRAIDLFDHIGLVGLAYGFIPAAIRMLQASGARFGAEWVVPAGRMRAFAEKVGVRWWLEVLEGAGL